MIEHFDINRVSLGGPIFDVEKLNWLNGQWIKALSPTELLDTLLAWSRPCQTGRNRCCNSTTDQSAV